MSARGKMRGPSRGASRRRFLTRAGAAAGITLGAPWVRAARSLTFPDDPFTLGVASGYPEPDGVALWTRLAPDPLLGGGMPREPVVVEWEVAPDERMSRIARRGRALATPDWAHSVHVEVGGLEPDRWYWYRFRAGGAESPVGRTRTAPARGAALERFRFGFCSCQHYEHGYYAAFRHMAAEELDLIVHLGDYIYEGASSRHDVRSHDAPEPVTLDDYRARLALYKSDPDLQAAHASCPWLVTWDDHEVDNDYAADLSERLDTPGWFLARRSAAYRAFYEHMPLRRNMVPYGPDLRLFTRVGFGDLATFHVLDDRQYRSHHACPPPGEGGSTVLDASGCEALRDPDRTLLGSVQERWLDAGLRRSEARWNVLAQQTLMARLDRARGEGERYWTDGWDGYPMARARLLGALAQSGAGNPLVVGGDVHSFWAADLKADFDDPDSPAVASEFVGGSITSSTTRSDETIGSLRAENPHVRYALFSRRGYGRIELTPERAAADFRAVLDVTRRDSGVETIASFVVEDGRPGVLPG